MSRQLLRQAGQAAWPGTRILLLTSEAFSKSYEIHSLLSPTLVAWGEEYLFPQDKMGISVVIVKGGQLWAVVWISQ